MGIMQLVREEADNEGLGPDATAEEQVELATTVANDGADIDAESADIDTDVASVEDAVDETDDLEDQQAIVEAALENGEGLAPETAESISIAVESAKYRLGLWDQPAIVPVGESAFANADSRLYSTRLVGEGIKDTIKQVWAAIKSMAARVWDKIKMFVAKIIGSSKMLVNQAETLQARARKVPESWGRKEAKIKSAGLARAIEYKGKADLSTLKQIIDNTGKLIKFAGETADRSNSIVDAARALANGEFTDASVSAFTKSSSKLSAEVLSGLNQTFANAVFDLPAGVKQPKKQKGSKSSVHAVGPFIGGTALVLSHETQGSGDDQWTTFSMSFEKAPGKKGLSEVEGLKIGEIREVLKGAATMAATLNDLERTRKLYEKLHAQIQSTADAVLKTAGQVLDKTGSSTETRVGLKAIRENVKDTIGTMNALGQRVPALAHQLVRTQLSYASLSLSNLAESGKK